MARSLQMGKGWEDACVLGKCSSEEGFKNQIDRVAPSVDSQPPPPHPSHPYRMRNDIMKTQLQHLLGDNSLEGCGRVLQEVVCALNRRPLYVATSPTATIRRSRSDGVKWE